MRHTSLRLLFSIADALKREHRTLLRKIQSLPDDKNITEKGCEKTSVVPALEAERQKIRQLYSENAEKIKAELDVCNIVRRKEAEILRAYYCDIDSNASSLDSKLQCENLGAAKHLKARLEDWYISTIK